MKYFTNPDQRAAAYAAYKTLERMLEKDGDIPPGYYKDFSGTEITIKLPNGSVVERDLGTNNNGTILKKATQNLYGYALWALFIKRLKKFNQWNSIKNIVIDALKEVVQKPTKNLKKTLELEIPDIIKEIESLQQQLEIPARIEATPRVFKETKEPATITIKAA